MNDQNLIRSGRIARKLGFWIGSFFLVAAICLLGWAYAFERHQSLTELQNLARTNIEFVGDLRLPYSPRLASQLSEILHLKAGFHIEDGSDQGSPDEIGAIIHNLARNDPGGAARRRGNMEIAFVPLPDREGYFFLVRDLEAKGNSTEAWWRRAALPIGILAFGCAALAFGLGKSIVNPLTELTCWLPNLREDDENETIPERITTRSDEVGYLARALETLKRELSDEREKRAQSEKMAALGRIATSLAHEVKNPAAAIRMHADLLLDESPPSLEGDSSLELIREEIDQITDLVNQWLFVSKATPSERRHHDLRQLLERVHGRMARLLEDRDIDFRIVADEHGSFPVMVDAPRVEQAFRNLLQNAIDAIPGDGRISVRLSLSGDEVLAIFEDTGPGFTPQALRQFREPFFSEREGGMGIGLTLACEVIESHGGQIAVENRREPEHPSGAIVSVSFVKAPPQSTP